MHSRVDMGVDITCGEMALATNLLQGQASEWALLRRHPSEDIFGVQICGGFADAMCTTAQMIEEVCGDGVDFVDINMGCPIDLICNKSAGSALLQPRNHTKARQIIKTMSTVLNRPLTIKIRKGYVTVSDPRRVELTVIKAEGA